LKTFSKIQGMLGLMSIVPEVSLTVFGTLIHKLSTSPDITDFWAASMIYGGWGMTAFLFALQTLTYFIGLALYLR
jgi:hypothetical protein